MDRTDVYWHITSLADLDPVALALRMRIGEDFPNFGDTDDVEQWERAQRGLRDVPEAQWLRTGRGMGLDPELQSLTAVGVPLGLRWRADLVRWGRSPRDQDWALGRRWSDIGCV